MKKWKILALVLVLVLAFTACSNKKKDEPADTDVTEQDANNGAEDSTKDEGQNADSADKECARYAALIKSMGKVDLQLLGLGHNGHIGFNEPAEYFVKDVNCVDLTEMTIQANKRFFASADEVPRQAYTMGIGTIMNAEKIVIVVSGKDKAEIVKKAFFGPVTPQVPASILQFHKDVTLIADEDALSLI